MLFNYLIGYIKHSLYIVLDFIFNILDKNVYFCQHFVLIEGNFFLLTHLHLVTLFPIA